MNLELIKSSYWGLYQKKQPITIAKHFNHIKDQSISEESIRYYASRSSVYSCLIEGSNIDFDLFCEYSTSNAVKSNKHFIEILDLIKSYEFASEAALGVTNFMKSHSLLSEHLIEESKYRGRARDKSVFIEADGIRVYDAASPDIVEDELKTLFRDITILLEQEMDISEIFYYASMIHLTVAHIHPFGDGNGRAARLLEKWFLAQKLGKTAWFIQSEKMYQTRLRSYYKNINIGKDYKSLNYDLSLPFLLMLPMSLTMNKHDQAEILF